MVYVKKIHPVEISNKIATEIITEFPIVNNKWDTRMFEIEFYDKDGNPISSYKGESTGLPADKNLVLKTNDDFNSPSVKEMFDTQDKLIFDEIKQMFGLTYYDDTYTVDGNRKFSYITMLPDNKIRDGLTTDLNDFKPNIGNNFQIIGKRCENKNVLVKDVITKTIQSNNIESVTIFTYLNSTNNYSYLNNLTTCNIYNYDEAIVKEMIDKQKLNKQNSDILKPVLVIMDDCICEDECNNDNIRELLLNGRNYNIFTIITCQYAIRFPPELRCNFDYTSSLKDTNISYIQRLYEYYYGGMPSFDMFHDTMMNMNDNECIIVNPQTGLTRFSQII